MVDLVDIKQKYVHFGPLLQTENQCPVQFLSWKCKCVCKLSEKLQCLVLFVNASTCMRAAVAFISPLCVTDMCERHGWAEPSKVASDGRTVRASWETHTHTCTQVYWQWPLTWRWKPVTFTLAGLLRWGLGEAAEVKTTERGSNWNMTSLGAS